MSRTLGFGLTLGVLGAIACSDQQPTAPATVTQLSSPALEMERAEAKSWKAHCTGNVTFVDATHLEIRGTCRFAHIGLVAVTIHQVLTYGQVISYSGRTTYTSRNGSELYTTHVGIATPTTDGSAVTLAGTETAIGGTGRFAGASGSAAITGTSILFGPGAGTGFYDLLGTLRLAGKGNDGDRQDD